MMKPAANSSAWALGQQRRGGFHVRRVVWGLCLAKAELREDEEIRAATILVEVKKRTKIKTLAKAKARGGHYKAVSKLDPVGQLDLRRSDLQYFDRLPEKLRRIIDNTSLKCSSEMLYRRWHDDGLTVRQVIREIQDEQKRVLARQAIMMPALKDSEQIG